MGVLKQCNITNSYYSEPLVCCVDNVQISRSVQILCKYLARNFLCSQSVQHQYFASSLQWPRLRDIWWAAIIHNNITQMMTSRSATYPKYGENEDPEAMHLLIVLCFTELSWILCSSGCHLLQHSAVVGDGDDGSTEPTCSCEHPVNVCTACRYTEEQMLDILDRHQSGAHQGSTSDANNPQQQQRHRFR